MDYCAAGGEMVGFTFIKVNQQCLSQPLRMNRIFRTPEFSLVLEPFIEPEVILLLTADQIKGLTKKTVNRNSTQTSTLTSFGTCIKQLNRPVTCILFTGAKLRTSEKKRTSGVGASTSLSINELCSDLQIRWGVRATRICSTVHDVALVLASYHRSIGERPFKEGRLSRDEGLTFLPDTVRKGLTGCASRGRGAGTAPNISGDDPDGTDSLAVHAWANRLWLAQLGQWRGLTGEVAHAIAQVYPTAFSFFQASQKDFEAVDATNSEGSQTNGKRRHPLEASLAELEIRRGAGILSSRRRLGPEFARRLVTHFTSEDPNQVIG
ncbi:hypothetical protein CRM22_006986 [Opisthorchis felineus]|uniref:ERCC4 domain-containing protein n=1 Tax=Opisthorchis felineus TaxID=147828 RepID=A0A4S2LIA9_OPIFE|nr:hypothetical protein CRM22_006986 [Opisthorchis felineus]TGZ63326.1 hypothetical protein CRM22_006986 [Opisthorchis felineus]